MKIIGIYLRSDKKSDPVSVTQADAIVGTGLEGDHFKKKGGLRQITILSLQTWKAACRELGVDLDPIARRANLLVDSIDLANTVGKTLKIGEVTIHVEGETLPCRVMDDAQPG